MDQTFQVDGTEQTQSKTVSEVNPGVFLLLHTLLKCRLSLLWSTCKKCRWNRILFLQLAVAAELTQLTAWLQVWASCEGYHSTPSRGHSWEVLANFILQRMSFKSPYWNHFFLFKCHLSCRTGLPRAARLPITTATTLLRCTLNLLLLKTESHVCRLGPGLLGLALMYLIVFENRNVLNSV